MQEDDGREPQLTREGPSKVAVDAMMSAEPRHPVVEHTKTVCDACREAGELLERRAAGHGTIDEIREAITILEMWKRRGLKLGQKIRVKGKWWCPRCTPDDVRPPELDGINRRARRAIAKGRL